MSAGAMLPPWVRKEVRALLPAWVGAMGAVAAAPLLGDTPLYGAAALAFGFSTIALGAQSIGQEYTHHTLPLLLAQPVDRRRIYMVKTGILAVMVLSTVFAAWMAGIDDFVPRDARRQEFPLRFVAAAGGLAVAPWLTMLSRGTLPGVVFTIAIPGLLLLIGTLIGAITYGVGHGAQVNAISMAVLGWGMSGIAIVAALSSWVMFQRLETGDGVGRQLQMPRFLRMAVPEASGSAVPTRRRHPMLLLVVKELRLQQMTFVVFGIYVLGWISLTWSQRLFSGKVHYEPVTALSALYGVLLAVLIGSLASAEERQFGTHAPNLLLPLARWKGWAVKAGVAFGLALVLGIVLPSLLMLAGWRLFGWEVGFAPVVLVPLVVTVILATSGSLFVSSFSASGVRATVVCFPFMLSAAALLLLVQSVVLRLSYRFLPSPGRNRLKPGQSFVELQDLMFTTAGILLAGGIVLLLYLSYVNYRSEERSTGRVAVQAVWIAGYLAFTAAIMTLLPPLYLSRG